MSRIKKLPWAEILVTAIVVAAGAGVYAWAHRDQGDLEESKRRGATLVQALRAYHAGHGTYPERLDELVPRYIAAVEPPTWGLGQWRYRRYSAAELAPEAAAAARDAVFFQLSVAGDESGYPMLFYDPALDDWVLNN
ncbi:MAG TPA: hypothetical protein VFZ69_04515 [Longimicrobiales bacterium]